MQNAKEHQKKDDDDSGNGSGSSGALIVNITCTLSNLRYLHITGLFPAQQGQGKRRKAVNILREPENGRNPLHLPQMCPEILPEVCEKL